MAQRRDGATCPGGVLFRLRKFEETRNQTADAAPLYLVCSQNWKPSEAAGVPFGAGARSEHSPAHPAPCAAVGVLWGLSGIARGFLVAGA